MIIENLARAFSTCCLGGIGRRKNKLKMAKHHTANTVTSEKPLAMAIYQNFSFKNL